MLEFSHSVIITVGENWRLICYVAANHAHTIEMLGFHVTYGHLPLVFIQASSYISGCWKEI